MEQPSDVVRWLGAIQAQDYLGALWAIGLRLPRTTEPLVERALTDRTIVRSWPMRGTLHIVAATDLRWMLDLLSPRIVARTAQRLRRDYDLTEALLRRCRTVLVRELRDGRHLTRPDLYRVLENARIATTGERGLHILWRLAQDGLLCFGAREGKQQTFVLLDEWVTGTKRLAREEALGALARRYFTSHGPATVQDFAWWSGLSAADARAALESVKRQFTREVIQGHSYWRSHTTARTGRAGSSVYLLPAYDEYSVAYHDRSAILAPAFATRTDAGSAIFHPTIVVDGQVVGTWTRALEDRRVVITTNAFAPLARSCRRALIRAANRYGRFLGHPAVVQ